MDLAGRECSHSSFDGKRGNRGRDNNRKCTIRPGNLELGRIFGKAWSTENVLLDDSHRMKEFYSMRLFKEVELMDHIVNLYCYHKGRIFDTLEENMGKGLLKIDNKVLLPPCQILSVSRVKFFPVPPNQFPG
nr:hypothetical transcript [Hymenolepis microstoma]